MCGCVRYCEHVVCVGVSGIVSGVCVCVRYCDHVVCGCVRYCEHVVCVGVSGIVTMWYVWVCQVL